MRNPITDIHTHRFGNADHAIVNIAPGEYDETSDMRCSAGLHPWRINADYPAQLDLLSRISSHKNIVAIGEAGIDRLCAIPLPLQFTVFDEHIRIAETVGKPLIVHCVKAASDILAAHKRHRPFMPWIIHGFRGKPQLAQQLLDAGFYLSLGEKFNPETARIIPIDHLFAESDESPTDMASIHAAIAQTKGMTPNELSARISENIARIF